MAEDIEPFWAGALELGTAEEALVALQAAGGVAERVGVDELAVANVPPERARRWLAVGPLRTRGLALTAVDPRYPARLARVVDAPPVLLVEGDAAVLDVPAVAIVGTRNCTAYGRSVARSLAFRLARQGRVIVSGLARGIDAAAHAGALDGGRTVAVLGHGLAHTSPAGHFALRRAIVDGGGAVVSSWQDGFEAGRWTFPRRNRWIAGLVGHVVVVEAPARSGALITAEEARALEGDALAPVLWAVPGPAGAPSSEGCRELIARGEARTAASVDALVRLIVDDLPVSAEGALQAWVDRLCSGAALDDVARDLGTSTIALVREVVRLELQGVLVRLPGQRYARSGDPSA